LFGANVFNLSIMQSRLPKGVFKSLKRTLDNGAKLDPTAADVVASAMKDWPSRRARPITRTSSSRSPA